MLTLQWLWLHKTQPQLITSNSAIAQEQIKMPSAGTIFTDILDDTLLLGSLAAEIFVKNPNSQATAGRVISAVSQLLQVINAQVNPPQNPVNPVTPTS